MMFMLAGASLSRLVTFMFQGWGAAFAERLHMFCRRPQKRYFAGIVSCGTWGLHASAELVSWRAQFLKHPGST